MTRYTSEQIWKKIQKGVFIVAEIGKNFIQTEEDRPLEEYIENAKKLIQAATASGADAVKFQTHNVEDEQLNIKVTSPHFSGTDRYSWVKRNTEATPREFWQELKTYCDTLGIVFFSTPMSRGAAMKLQKVGVPLWKIGSGDVLDFVTLDFVAGTGKPIIISSGMSTLEEIDRAIEFLKRRTERVALLHCVSKYPCPPEELNLNTIKLFQKRYGIPIGFSDHSLGYESAIAAVEMGATVIEKHFSFSRNLWGADHKVSMSPQELQDMVRGIKDGTPVQIVNFGQEAKILQEGEAVFRKFFRKSLVAGKDIDCGKVITPQDIYAMRPQGYINALPSEEYEAVVGKKATKGFKKYDPILSQYLE